MDANNIMTGIPLHVYEPEEEDYSVYIVLSKTQTLPSQVIKLWTREPYGAYIACHGCGIKGNVQLCKKALT